MITQIKTAMPYGYDGIGVTVEGAISNGLPGLTLIGMANKTITESKERVRTALKASGFDFPDKKLTLSLTPVELPKTGSQFDLAIAVAVLSLSGQLRNIDLSEIAFIGALSLTGEIQPIRGIISMIETLESQGLKKIFIPKHSFIPFMATKNSEIIAVESIKELYKILKNEQEYSTNFTEEQNVVNNTETDTNTRLYDKIISNEIPKRALLISAAGNHNILFSGPPGTGKTMLAKSLIDLLPAIDEKAAISTFKIHDLAGIPIDLNTRPFRSPHHSCTKKALTGGGSKILPGELSLAHNGVLFLDELPEFSSEQIETLRQPLEEKKITLSRAEDKVTFPCDFILIATMNPCPCGYLGDPNKECTCSQAQIANYSKKISGPILDRIDLRVEVPRVEHAKLLTSPQKVSSLDVVKNNITVARQRQNSRYGQNNLFNGTAPTSYITSKANLTSQAKKLLETAAASLSLSARAYFKTLRVAMTIADLESSAKIEELHIAEALSFR